MATTPIDLNSIFDTRDVLDRLAFLEADGEQDEEHGMLTAFVSEMTDYFGEQALRDGITIIPDDEFEDYAKELAWELGAITEDSHWPAAYIDWEAAAEALQMDYTAFDFDGVTYWGRE